MVAPDLQPPSGFGADDFVRFDFGQDEATEAVTPIHGHPEAGPSSRPASPKPLLRERRQPKQLGASSHKGTANNKKRRLSADDGSLPVSSDQGDARTKKDKQRAAARGTPWSVDVDWASARNAAQQLHREMMAFERWIAPTKEEHQSRKMVIRLIRNAINSQWRDAEVHSFGSQDTELYLPQGDIDLVVVSQAMESQRRENVLRAMAACLRRNNLATDVLVIAKAKVPIIKFVCTHGRYRCDISVNQTNGLRAAEWVNDQQERMPAIRPLIMLTKHLLQQRGMSEVYTGGLGSFSVILLVISFVQMHPRIQRGEIDPARNLGVLFLDFLELYGKNFGYDDTGIAVTGCGSYFHKSRRGWKDAQKPFKVSIEDPQNADNDIATGSYNIISVRSSLAGAFDILTTAVCERGYELSRGRSGGSAGDSGRFGPGSKNERHHRFEQDAEEAAREALLSARGPRNATGGLEKDPESLLGSIVGVSRELMKNRKDIDTLYHSGVLQKLLGKSPPRRSPSPGPSTSRRGEARRPPEPAGPAPPDPPVPPPPHGLTSMRASGKEIGGRSASRNSSVDTVLSIKGLSAKRLPTFEREQDSGRPHHSTPLRTAVKAGGESNKRGDDGRRNGSAGRAPDSEGRSDDEPDSRYAAHAKSLRMRRKEPVKKRRRDMFDEPPSVYVSEESEEGEEAAEQSDDDDMKTAEASPSPSPQLAKRKQILEGKRQQSFWLDKGAARLDEEDEEDEYVYEDQEEGEL